MAVATDEVRSTDDDARVTPSPTSRIRLAPVLVVALVASPVIVAALSLVGDSWLPVGDWASLAYRTSQVGTGDTPLVGTYSVKGWAHPGPLVFWLAAPLFHLSGGDARSLEWTAAAINVATIVALGAVAWRRGRWPLLVGVMGMTAVLVHSIAPELLIDLWNPHIPLLPFLLTVVLVWDAALGRRRALVEAAIPACFAMQSHLAFVSLVGLLAVWLWAWSRWWPRLLPTDTDTPPDTETDTATPPDGDTGTGTPPGTGAGGSTADLPRPPWQPWWRHVRWGVGVVALLSVGPLIDSLVDLHNPLRIVKSFGDDSSRLGLADAVGLVGRYVRPDGPWVFAPAPLRDLSVVGSGPLPVIAAVALLGGCFHLARRRGLVDVAALSCLAVTLVLGSIVGTSQFVPPVERYLAQWLKIIGALVWFTVGWTAWRLAAPAVAAVPRRRLAAATLAGTALVAGAAWSWADATRAEPQFADEGEIVTALGAELADVLPDDQVIRIERRGEPWHIFSPGLVYDLIDRGVPVITSDGGAGLKWGHEHRWVRGDPYDMLLTIAVHDAGSFEDAFDMCMNTPRMELIASYDALSPGDRAWLDDYHLRRLDGPDAVTAAEVERGQGLETRDLRIGVFEGPRVCGRDPSLAESAADPPKVGVPGPPRAGSAP